MPSALYTGELVHTRRDTVGRTFRYPVFVAAIDLDELASIDLHLFGHNRRALFALRDRDYTTPLSGGGTLITNLRTAGYTFNPVSFFLRYDGDGIASVVAEVNNTYGGRHCYALDDAARLPDRAGRAGFRTPRELFVSPFLHGPRTYEVWVPARRDPPALAITMHVDAPDGERVFTATLTGTRQPLTDVALAKAALRYPLMTAQVIALIHLEAFKLRYLHRLPYRRPGPDHRPLDSENGG